MAEASRPPLIALCRVCQLQMELEDVVEQSETTPRIEVLKCPTGHGKIACVFELTFGGTAETEAFVQREIARRGAFFPSDYNRGGGRGWR